MGDNASGMDVDARAAERREDAALVEQARADDPDAFGLLYDRWFDRVNDLDANGDVLTQKSATLTTS